MKIDFKKIKLNMLLVLALVQNLASAQVTNVGKPVITKRVACTPTWDSATTSYIASSAAWCWRVGDTLHIDGYMQVNASAVGASAVTLTLPANQGYVIDTTKLANTATDHTAVAVGPARTGNLDVYRNVTPVYGGSTTTVRFLNATTYVLPEQLTASGKNLRYKLELPIVGW